ncbi:methyl-accepting chemotaxis protein [Reinekea blandensis]|uniref:Methyl-accepting chemotaxis protein n=1 Tax=Reinekea blandensis MED297 TaxID=314283 RepID=A4BI81_9GAMM|nr:methyl-accepting chemotaxis protein [Reinekea blandensis]EAR08224.1 methyl-accepting chemotaxis protein [Reinekea sp. MED297] [Reinekea blandensis MED297]
MKPLSVKQKLTFSTAIVVLVLLAAYSFLNYQQAKTRVINSANNDIARVGDNLAGFVADWIEAKRTILDAASGFSEIRSSHNQILEQGQQSGDFLYMYFGTRDGEMIMFPQESLPDDYDPRTRPWYQQATQQNGPILTEPYVDASSGALVLSFAQPTAIGVIAADIAMTQIANEVLDVSLGVSGIAIMVDADNNILIHPDSEQVGQPLNSLMDTTGLGEQVSTLKTDSQPLLGASFAVDGTPWQIIITVDRKEALAELTSLATRSWILSLIIIGLVTLAVSVAIGLLLKPLDALKNALEDIADGDADLTKRLDVISKDEIGHLSTSFNQFVDSIHHLVIDVVDSSAQLLELSQQSNSAASENNLSIQKQQDEITQVAAAIHEMSSTSATVAENARITAESAEEAQKESDNSETNASNNRQRMRSLTEQIDNTTGVISKLNEHAQQINSILTTIQGIAEQTNLLALNAAIEAARAGEQGRGFAVVADEVRSLSQRTHEATGEIQTMIEALGEHTRSAVTQMDTSKTLVEETMSTAEAVSHSQETIKQVITDINHQAVTISEAAREQNTATEEINRITQTIQQESQQLSENVESAYHLSEQLNELGERVQAHLKGFRT